MTIRTRFNLIAACIALPSALAVAYYLIGLSDSWNLQRRAGSPRARDWVERTISGAEDTLHDRFQDIEAIAIRQSDGSVAFSNARGLAKGEVVSPAQLLERVTAAYPGAPYVLESLAGQSGGSYVAVGRPEPEPWYLSPYVIGTGLAIAFECLFVIVGIVLMLRTSSSILALGESAKRIARGDLAFALEGRGNDEISMLYRSFDQMRRELAEAQDGRSRFLMGVSHDLRTPLTSIKGYIQALEEGMAQDAAMQESFLGILKAKAELLESRIQELIEFAGFETAAWRPKLIDLRIRDFLEEMAHAAASDAEVRDRKFSSYIRVDSASVIKADPRLFQHVLENLLSNAMRYSRPGDTVALEADESEAGIRIVVRDDGPGIPSEDRLHVFDEFYRGRRARDGEGLGLGLTIVKSVVSAHEWKVCLSEDGGPGTSFVISIPKPR